MLQLLSLASSEVIEPNFIALVLYISPVDQMIIMTKLAHFYALFGGNIWW